MARLGIAVLMVVWAAMTAAALAWPHWIWAPVLSSLTMLGLCWGALLALPTRPHGPGRTFGTVFVLVTLVCLLGDLRLNDEAVAWLASSGTLGPDNAWDTRLRRVPALLPSRISVSGESITPIGILMEMRNSFMSTIQIGRCARYPY